VIAPNIAKPTTNPMTDDVENTLLYQDERDNENDEADDPADDLS
jgi:hypothetical protein